MTDKPISLVRTEGSLGDGNKSLGQSLPQSMLVVEHEAEIKEMAELTAKELGQWRAITTMLMSLDWRNPPHGMKVRNMKRKFIIEIEK